MWRTCTASCFQSLDLWRKGFFKISQSAVNVCQCFLENLFKTEKCFRSSGKERTFLTWCAELWGWGRHGFLVSAMTSRTQLPGWRWTRRQVLSHENSLYSMFSSNDEILSFPSFACFTFLKTCAKTLVVSNSLPQSLGWKVRFWKLVLDWTTNTEPFEQTNKQDMFLNHC